MEYFCNAIIYWENVQNLLTQSYWRYKWYISKIQIKNSSDLTDSCFTLSIP